MKPDFQNQQPSYLNERKKFINNAQPMQGQTFDQYKEQQEQFNKEKEAIEGQLLDCDTFLLALNYQ